MPFTPKAQALLLKRYIKNIRARDSRWLQEKKQNSLLDPGGELCI